MTKNLLLLNGIPNIVSMPQASVDSYKIEDDEIEQFYDSVKLFSVRAKNDKTFKYVDFHIKSNFKYLDFVKIPKYPLLAVYNNNTHRCLINISGTLKGRVQNIVARDLYAMIVYGHVCACISNAGIDKKNHEPFCNYMALMYLKIFSKKYGITGSYADLIPQFKFIIYLFTLIKFFNYNGKEALKMASNYTGYDPNKLNIPSLNDYDLMNVKDMIRLLSDTGTCPGLGAYKFIETMIKYFGVMNLALFEDLMRFCCVMFTSTINSNSFFSPSFQLAYSQTSYDKINDIIEGNLTK